jgi:hypothetical protein
LTRKFLTSWQLAGPSSWRQQAWTWHFGSFEHEPRQNLSNGLGRECQHLLLHLFYECRRNWKLRSAVSVLVVNEPFWEICRVIPRKQVVRGIHSAAAAGVILRIFHWIWPKSNEWSRPSILETNRMQLYPPQIAPSAFLFTYCKRLDHAAGWLSANARRLRLI